MTQTWEERTGVFEAVDSHGGDPLRITSPDLLQDAEPEERETRALPSSGGLP